MLMGKLRRVAGPLLRVVHAVRDRKAQRETAQWLETIAAQFGGFAGKRVLDVGTDLDGNLVRVIGGPFGAREVVGLNLAITERTLAPNIRLEQADIRRTRYEDGYFDLIFSSSAFEHITGLEEGLAEMHRILKPGGHLFSHFGPIWSTTYGHHLWTTHRGRVYTYWDVLLPPFCHLLQSQAEIEEILAGQGHDRELSRVLSEYVTSSPEQNRLFFEDYEAMVARSPFERVIFKGYDYPELAKRYNARITPEILQQLQTRHPGKTGFFYDGITMLLRKRA